MTRNVLNMNAEMFLLVLVLTLKSVSCQVDDVLALIQKDGYTGEAHDIETEDGYILRIHRVMPRSGNLKTHPVFLMHGLFATSADFIITGPEVALAYLLADNGYDVWLGNARGSKFSMSANESHDGRDFWDFSWHEIGYYDLPCMLDHVLQETKMRQVFFVAHSQGATSLLVLLSTRPEYNEKIIQGHLMAPAVFLGHTPHPFLRPLANEVESGLLDDYKYLDLATIWEYGGSFADYLCDDNQTSIYCTVVLWWIFGANKNGVEVDIRILRKLIDYVSPKISVMQLMHFGQLIKSGKFQQFNYHGNNSLHYNSEEPPDYRLANVSTSIFLYQAAEDLVIARNDIEHLEETLPNVKEYCVIDNWNHGDFVYGMRARKILYQPILEAFESVEVEVE